MYSYSSLVTPRITSIFPTRGSNGTVKINGIRFRNDNGVVSVKIGDSSCLILNANDTQITCILNSSRAGVFSTVVLNENYGLSNSDVKFTYDLSIYLLSNTKGLQALKNVYTF